MSTNAIVARKVEQGYTCIYVHWDGYHDGNGVGPTLKQYFTTDEMVRELIALGDCSVIAGATSAANVTAYARDKGESYNEVAPLLIEKAEDIQDAYPGSCQHLYIWDDEGWTAFAFGDEVQL